MGPLMTGRDGLEPQFREQRYWAAKSPYADLPEHEIPSRILHTLRPVIAAIAWPLAWVIKRVTRRSH
jgi:hypothetical protein